MLDDSDIPNKMLLSKCCYEYILPLYIPPISYAFWINLSLTSICSHLLLPWAVLYIITRQL